MLWFLLSPILVVILSVLFWKESDIFQKVVIGIGSCVIGFVLAGVAEAITEAFIPTEWHYLYSRPIVAMFDGPSPYLKKCHTELTQYSYYCFYYVNTDDHSINYAWFSPDKQETNGYTSDVYEENRTDAIEKVYQFQLVGGESLKWIVFAPVKDRYEIDLILPNNTFKSLENK